MGSALILRLLARPYKRSNLLLVYLQFPEVEASNGVMEKNCRESP